MSTRAAATEEAVQTNGAAPKSKPCSTALSVHFRADSLTQHSFVCARRSRQSDAPCPAQLRRRCAW